MSSACACARCFMRLAASADVLGARKTQGVSETSRIGTLGPTWVVALRRPVPCSIRPCSFCRLLRER